MRETADEGTNRWMLRFCWCRSTYSRNIPRVASLRAAALAVCMCLSTLFSLCTVHSVQTCGRERERELWAGAMKPDANLH